ncbi:MAG: HAD-IC family P-type ATPase, partial [Arcobacteraceae bacterium]
MKEFEEKSWHSLSTDEVIAYLNSDLKNGLNDDELLIRQKYFGLNQLTPKQESSLLVDFLLQFHTPLVYILLIAALVTFVLEEYVDSSVIFGVVLVNAIIGFLQENKAKQAINSLKHMLNTKSIVLRNSNKVSIDSKEITVGDIVFLSLGDKIPADMRIVSAKNLHIDESALTGESVPTQKNVDVLDKDTVLADRDNMAYGGTLVTYGQGVGIVIAIGDNTQTGKIASLIHDTISIETPLTKKISEFSKTLLWIILALAGLTFLFGYFIHDYSAIDMFMASVALAVGAIPEGLPAVVTITLAIGVRVMATKNAIIRKLPAVETLGSTTVICSDKTGTLTKNEMTVTKICIDNHIFDIGGNGYEPHGEIVYNGNKILQDYSYTLAEILRCGMLCNDSILAYENGRYNIQG